MAWSAEMVADLRRLWDRDYTASQIASTIGGLTRNAVLGAARRLKLPPRRQARWSGPRTGTWAEREQRKDAARQRRNERDRNKRLMARLLATPIEEIPLFQIWPCQLLELDDTTCRWPNGEVGQPGFHFCGATPATSSPYCPHHTRLAYRPRSAA